MRPRRLHAVLIVVVVCALAVGGVIAALLLTRRGHKSATDPPTTAVVQTTGSAPTTGDWAPITVTRPKLPVIGGGIPVDVDPIVSRTDFNTTLFPVGPDRYRMTIFNTSSLGAISSLQWYPPVGVRIVKVLGSTAGRCVLTGLSGFGGNQFPTIVLYPNIFCDRLDLKPATCICRGDGGAVTITFRTNKHLAVNDGDLRLRTATVAFERIPLTPQTGPPAVRHVMRIATPRAVVGWADCRGASRCAARPGRPAGFEHLAPARDDHDEMGAERSGDVPGRPRVAEPEQVQGLRLLGPLARRRAVHLAQHESRGRPTCEHVHARHHSARAAGRQADAERSKRESTVGRHHTALAVRAPNRRRRATRSWSPTEVTPFRSRERRVRC